jgi:hypothetical protein
LEKVSKAFFELLQAAPTERQKLGEVDQEQHEFFNKFERFKSAATQNAKSQKETYSLGQMFQVFAFPFRIDLYLKSLSGGEKSFWALGFSILLSATLLAVWGMAHLAVIASVCLPLCFLAVISFLASSEHEPGAWNKARNLLKRKLGEDKYQKIANKLLLYKIMLMYTMSTMVFAVFSLSLLSVNAGGFSALMYHGSAIQLMGVMILLGLIIRALLRNGQFYSRFRETLLVKNISKKYENHWKEIEEELRTKLQSYGNEGSKSLSKKNQASLMQWFYNQYLKMMAPIVENLGPKGLTVVVSKQVKKWAILQDNMAGSTASSAGVALPKANIERRSGVAFRFVTSFVYACISGFLLQSWVGFFWVGGLSLSQVALWASHHLLLSLSIVGAWWFLCWKIQQGNESPVKSIALLTFLYLASSAIRDFSTIKMYSKPLLQFFGLSTSALPWGIGLLLIGYWLSEIGSNYFNLQSIQRFVLDPKNGSSFLSKARDFKANLNTKTFVDQVRFAFNIIAALLRRCVELILLMATFGGSQGGLVFAISLWFFNCLRSVYTSVGVSQVQELKTSEIWFKDGKRQGLHFCCVWLFMGLTFAYLFLNLQDTFAYFYKVIHTAGISSPAMHAFLIGPAAYVFTIVCLISTVSVIFGYMSNTERSIFGESWLEVLYQTPGKLLKPLFYAWKRINKDSSVLERQKLTRQKITCFVAALLGLGSLFVYHAWFVSHAASMIALSVAVLVCVYFTASNRIFNQALFNKHCKKCQTHLKQCLHLFRLDLLIQSFPFKTRVVSNLAFHAVIWSSLLAVPWMSAHMGAWAWCFAASFLLGSIVIEKRVERCESNHLTDISKQWSNGFVTALSQENLKPQSAKEAPASTDENGTTGDECAVELLITSILT